MPVAASRTAGLTCVRPLTRPCTTGSKAYSVSAITAGSRPTPCTPDAGQAAPMAASGAINRPNSASEGTVCTRFNAASSGPPSAGRCAAARPSGRPISSVQARLSATIWPWRHSAAWNTSCRFAYSRSSDSASSQPAFSISTGGSSRAACSSAWPPARSGRRRPASAAMAQASKAAAQKPPPSAMRASGPACCA